MLVVVVTLGVVALLGGVLVWRARRDARRVLGRVVDHLAAGTGLDPGPVRSPEELIERLDALLARVRREGSAAAAERERLARAFEVADLGVVVVDGGGRLVLRNGAAGRFSGARHADALAEGAIGELVQRALGGQVGERELQLFGPPRRVLQVRAVPLVREEELLGAVAFVRDVSEARRIESVRRDFVANVSHELKTPIGALALLAETLAVGGDPEVTRRLAGRVLEEADRLGRIVDDLLDLSLIEAQEAPSREPVPVWMIVADAVDRVRSAADAAGITLDVGTPADDLVVTCDRRQVVSAVANLLDNAVKYSEPGSAVELRVERDADRVELAVRDRGIGIPTRDLERIFERFYRVDRARSRATGGTGLGLSIVRHVAQAHGGEVLVESAEGEGSTFRLRLPRAGGAGRTPRASPVREASAS